MGMPAQKVVRAYGNFAKGQIDHDMMGRFDLPAYVSGMDVFQNFISNFKGNAIFSAGFISQVAFQDCAFIEFRFGVTQDYLCAFYNGNVQFLAFSNTGTFGWVLNGGGTPLTVTSPYTLADAQTISTKGSYAQNSDVMYLVHRNYAPYKLTRTAANAFTLATFLRTADPFANPATVVNDTSTTSNSIAVGALTFTVSASKGYIVGQPVNIVATGHAGNSVTGTVTSYSGTTLVVNINQLQGSGTYTSWTITMTTNGYPGAVAFYQGVLYYASATNALTSVWMSNAGDYDDFTIQSPITDASGFAFTIAGITQQIEWLFPGDISLIAGATDGIVAINGGGPNTAITPATVQASVTSAQPTNGVYPLKKDGLMFYSGKIGRNIYYFKYDILSEMFVALDANLSAYDITRGGLTKLRLKRDKYDLVFGLRGDNVLTSMCFNQYENVNGWHYRNSPGTGSDTIQDLAVMGDNLGNPQVFILAERNGTFYIEQQASYVEFAKRSDFWTQTPDSPANNPNADIDFEAYIRYVCEQLRQCNYLDNSLYYSDYRTSTITFTQTGNDPTTNAPIGTVVSGASDFSSGDVGKHIVYKTATGYESGRFEITAYTNGTTVSVLALQTPQTSAGGTVAALNVWSSWYKSFKTVTGLSQYNGETVGVVLDGGYDGPQLISGGTLTLEEQTTSICIGYQYTGIIKSMCIGFQLQGQNTQVTLKEISRVSLRCVNSLGLKVGSNLYDLQEVQLRSQQDFNYLPPAPIDGTQDIDVDSDSEEDFFFYAVQDQPLPANITNYFLEANYAMTT